MNLQPVFSTTGMLFILVVIVGAIIVVWALNKSADMPRTLKWGGGIIIVITVLGLVTGPALGRVTSVPDRATENVIPGVSGGGGPFGGQMSGGGQQQYQLPGSGQQPSQAPTQAPAR